MSQSKKLQDKIYDDLRQIDFSEYKTKVIDVMIKNTVNIHCKNCKSDNVYVFSKQVRSADEATSKFYTCLDCGQKWREN